jgi:hypothetical protein
MSQRTWHLIKASTKEEYGPFTDDELLLLAAEAKIAPMDRLSDDGRQSWRHAPMIAELQMDWLIEMQDQYLYGPTNISTIQEFMATGQIHENVNLINCLDHAQGRLRDQPFFKASPQQIRSATTTLMGAQWPDLVKGAHSLEGQQRVQHLEKQLISCLHQLDETQRAYAILRQQFIEATGHAPA